MVVGVQASLPSTDSASEVRDRSHLILWAVGKVTSMTEHTHTGEAETATHHMNSERLD